MRIILRQGQDALNPLGLIRLRIVVSVNGLRAIFGCTLYLWTSGASKHPETGFGASDTSYSYWSWPQACAFIDPLTTSSCRPEFERPKSIVCKSPNHLDSQDGYASWLPNFARGSDEANDSGRYYTGERLSNASCVVALEKAPRANVEDWIMLATYGLIAGVVVQTRKLPYKLEDIFAALQSLYSTQPFRYSTPRLQIPSRKKQNERLAEAIASSAGFLHIGYGLDRASNLIQAVGEICRKCALGGNPRFPKLWTRLRVPTSLQYLADRTVFVIDTTLIRFWCYVYRRGRSCRGLEP